MNLLPPNWPVTGLAVVGAGVLLSFFIDYLARTLDDGRFGWQRALRHRLGVADGKRITELRWVALSLQLTLWPVVAYMLLRVWGLNDLGQTFFDRLVGGGFSIGSTTIVPGKIVLGLVAFLLLVTFTRWFKRKLERDWLPLTRLEPSVRMSVATLYGYATFVIAMLVGLSAAGLDLSKIAIVAGALSVGIGFGLQNIVNNFVSGLILLFERPVRLGDYIKVGSTEGFVRQIRIRSTELENGERVSIIVPNSSLLSAEVENWNYRNSLGRVVVSVGVGYGVEPTEVRKILLEIADQHPMIIKEGERSDVPGPFVVFKDFGDSSLVFELRACISDIYSRLGVSSDLRFAIFERFRERKIEIPFPQRDVWIKNPHEVGRPARSGSGSDMASEAAD